MPEKESSLISNVWVQRNLGVDLAQNLTSVTPGAIDHLCNRVYPYLQVVSSYSTLSDELSIKFIPVGNTGCVIFDYGDALSTSASYGTNAKQASGEKWKNGCSMSNQMAVVSKVASLIDERKWGGAELIYGTPMMKRYLWIESKKYGFELTGYEPSDDDKKCLDRLMKQAKDRGLVWSKELSEEQRVVVASASGKE